MKFIIVMILIVDAVAARGFYYLKKLGELTMRALGYGLVITYFVNF